MSQKEKKNFIEDNHENIYKTEVDQVQNYEKNEDQPWQKSEQQATKRQS